MRRVALLVAVSLLWACTEGAVSTTTTTTTAPTSTTTRSSTSSTTISSTSTAAVQEWPELLVTNDDGVFYVDSAGEITQLVKGRVAYAVDDTRGGLLSQVERGRSGPEGPGSTEVWWVPQGASEAQALVVPTPGEGHDLTLYDAFEHAAGHLQVVYVRSETPAEYWAWVDCVHENNLRECEDESVGYPGIVEDLIDRLRIFDVDQRTVGELDWWGFESGVGEVSTGGGLVSVMTYDQVSSGCVFFDPVSAGPPIERLERGRSAPTVKVPGAPQGCEPSTDHPDCPEACRLSPMGSMLGYSLGSKLVLVDTTSGEPITEVPTAGDVVGFDLRDDYAVIMLADGPGVLVAVDGNGAEFEVPVEGIAGFVTAPIDIDVPVMLPTTVPMAGFPPLLVADSDGIRVVDEGAEVMHFLEGAVASVAVPDLSGGVVYQGGRHEITGGRWDESLGRNVFEWEEGGPDPIWRITGPGQPPQMIITHPDAELTLVDVVMVDSGPKVLYRMYIGGAQAEPVFDVVLEWLGLFDLVSGETEVLGLVGDYESSWTQMRVGGDLVAVTFDEYGESSGTTVGFIPFAALREEVGYDWLPTLAYDHLLYGPGASCSVSFGCYGWATATAASDGSRVSWVQGGRHWDTGGNVTVWPIEVATVDPETGQETMRRMLGRASLPVSEPGERVHFIDDDGSFIVMSGVGSEDEVVLVTPNEDVITVGYPGATVSLWETGG